MEQNGADGAPSSAPAPQQRVDPVSGAEEKVEEDTVTMPGDQPQAIYRTPIYIY